jgi:hypothetical protein
MAQGTCPCGRSVAIHTTEPRLGRGLQCCLPASHEAPPGCAAWRGSRVPRASGTGQERTHGCRRAKRQVDQGEMVNVQNSTRTLFFEHENKLSMRLLHDQFIYYSIHHKLQVIPKTLYS